MIGAWYLQPVLDSYLAAVALAAGLLGLLWLRPSFGRLTRERRVALTTIRGLIVALMVLALLRPTLVFTQSMLRSASLVVLFDLSRSMQLPDAAGDQSRWQAQSEALREAAPLLAQLDRDYDVKVYGYDSELHPMAIDGQRLGLPAAPDGDETDIGTSIDAALRQELGKRLAAVVVLGDGVQTAPDPQVEIHHAGRELARMGTPLYAVAFGPSGNAAQSRDVALENLPEQYTVFVKNELQVRGSLRVRGYVNQPIPVELRVEGPDGKQQVFGPRPVVARQDGQLLPVEMAFTPDQPGQYKLTMSAADQPGELVTANNSLTAFLTVLEGGLKVAYLYGSLVGEQRFLRWSLESSPDIDLDYVFLDPRNRQRWPDDRGDLLKNPLYDVYLIENVDAAAFRPADLQALAEAVGKGKGLMMLGGFHSFGPGGYYNTALRDVLPVEMGRFERQELDPVGPVSPDLHLSSESGIAPVPARPHPVTHLASEQENANVWSGLPPLTGANRFRGLKQNAQVLLESPQADPLLVAGEYGQGRTLAFAGDSTRRWWQHGHEVEHKRFWRQAILWLAHREDDQRSDVWIKLPQRRYSPKAPIRFETGARSASGDPIVEAELSAVLAGPGGSSQNVSLRRGEEAFEGEIREALAPGDYTLEVTARADGRTLGSTRAIFQVLDRDLELASAGADPDQLARLAALTKDADGRLIAAEQLPELLRDLERRLPEERLDVETRWRLGDTAWDAWLFFVTLVGLLTGEWLLRKRWGMV